jgi:hypothetical protein
VQKDGSREIRDVKAATLPANNTELPGRTPESLSTFQTCDVTTHKILVCFVSGCDVMCRSSETFFTCIFGRLSRWGTLPDG